MILTHFFGAVLGLKLLDFDYNIFKILNGLAGQSHSLDVFFVIVAEGILYLIFAGIAIFILMDKKNKERKIIALQALFAALISRVVFIELIRVFFFRLRPFVAGVVTQLVYHNPLEASFPSGHAAAMFAMAFTICFVSRKWGVFFLILALISSVCRVIVGVHYPMDIVGGFLVGILSVLAAKMVFDLWVRKRLAGPSWARHSPLGLLKKRK